VAFSNSYDVPNYSDGYRIQDISKDDKQREFFIHYTKHSEQLVTALKQWGEGLTFTSCEYDYGQLRIDPSEQIEPLDISYMELMKKHLEKGYPSILNAPAAIESKHKELCNQIEKTMVSLVSPIPYEPSYERIITDKIKSYCPSLKGSNDVELTQNNIYIEHYIFSKIFDKVSAGESTLILSVEDNYNNNVSRLLYQNTLTLGKGEKAVMNKLKEAVEELVIDDTVKTRIRDYNHLHNQLINDEERTTLMKKIQTLYDYTYGGQPLGGYPACDLCNPGRIP
jgi:hypothetical protein